MNNNKRCAVIFILIQLVMFRQRKQLIALAIRKPIARVTCFSYLKDLLRIVIFKKIR